MKYLLCCLFAALLLPAAVVVTTPSEPVEAAPAPEEEQPAPGGEGTVLVTGPDGAQYEIVEVPAEEEPLTAEDLLSFSFQDIPEGDPSAGCASYVAARKVLQGAGGGRFLPDQSVTRGALMVVIHRLAGEPYCPLAVGFPDLGPDDWQFDAVSWALYARIAAGNEDGTFAPDAPVTGGAAGIGVKLCITWGVKRGVFSNEAGLGSAPIAHAASSESNPVKQGLYGIFEVFMDTIVICTLSGLTILLALDEAALNYGVQGTTALNAQALGTVFGPKIGALIIAVGLSLFALSTILSWGLYGTRCWEFILGSKAIKPYQIIYTLVIIISATMELGLAWDIADTLNGLMAIPNLIGIIVLCPVVFKLTNEYFSGNKNLRK